MKHTSKRSLAPHRQRGVTVVIAMLFLLILTMFAVSGFNSSTTNTRITGNMIARNESLAAAQLLIDQTMSKKEFAKDPKSFGGQTLSVEMTGDTTADYIATISPAPACQLLRPVKNKELVAEVSDDVPCINGSDDDSDFDNPSHGNSACSRTEWNLRAVVTDTNTGAAVAINQGFGVRLEKNKAKASCL